MLNKELYELSQYVYKEMDMRVGNLEAVAVIQRLFIQGFSSWKYFNCVLFSVIAEQY